MASLSLSPTQKVSLEQSAGRSGVPIYRAIQGLLTRVPGEGKRLLDFGAGTGTLLTTLLNSPLCASGIGADLLPAPASLPDTAQWIQSDLNAALDLKERSVDLITAVEIIEHLENPRLIAREWFRLLQPGGYLICSTPNNRSIRSMLSLIVRGHFLEFGDRSYPSHITALLPIDLKRILEEAGFTEIEIHYTNHGIVPRLTSLSWQALSAGLLKGKFFSDNVIAVGRKPL